MVNLLQPGGMLSILADEDVQLPLEKLDPQARLTVWIMLVAVVTLGLFLLIVVSAAARFTRRYMNSGTPQVPSSAVRRGQDDWANSPLPGTGDEEPPSGTAEE